MMSDAGLIKPAVSAIPGNREWWLQQIQRVSEPVLANLAANTLRKNMPVEAAFPQYIKDRRTSAHLEAVGRLLAGIAPWLELAEKSGTETDPGQKFSRLACEGLAHAVDSKTPDAFNFSNGAQPLVDASFLAYALLLAPNALWKNLEVVAQKRLIASLQATHMIRPGMNNWLLFSAMIETFLAVAGAEWQAEPIDLALTMHEKWYKGDGAYGDGQEFHWDYYNSFVIQPFLVEILDRIRPVTNRWDGLRENANARAARYAAVQERLIAPDGTYPAIGRSIAYRCGAFHHLAFMALRRELPSEIKPAQVRRALSAVIHRTLDAPETFDENGWLRIGLAGHQPALGEAYISTGSLYLASFAFHPLGLPAGDPFWNAPDEKWTAEKIWSGENLPADHALHL